MTTLSQDTPRDFELGGENDLPVIADGIIYEGAAVGDNGAGYARPLQAGDPFRGFALLRANNSDGSAGDVRVHLRREGTIKLRIAGLGITDVGKPVYASDDDTFTLDAGSNTLIGYVVRHSSSGVGMVRFRENRGDEANLTDNSGGTASNTIAAISDTATKNAIASLTAKINYLLRQQGS